MSASVYHVHELAGTYWKHSIGHERATRMARLATVVREGIPLALHSDFTVAPAQPLNHAWVSVYRLCESGESAATKECPCMRGRLVKQRGRDVRTLLARP